MFFEILDKQTLKTENGLRFTFGMTKSEVAKLLKGYEYLYGKTYLIYPQKRKELEETFEYKKLDNIRLSYLNDNLISFHIPVKSNELFFKGINLLNEDYKDTVKQLKSNGNVCCTEKGVVFFKYIFSNIPAELIVEDNKLLQVNITFPEYSKRLDDELNLYYAKMSRDKEDNVVIRYTRIKK